jgi:hypothetical protein
MQVAPGRSEQLVYIGRIERVPSDDDPTASVEIGVLVLL